MRFVLKSISSDMNVATELAGCKLSHIELINNKVLLYNIRNYIKYPFHMMEKKMKKNINIYMCVCVCVYVCTHIIKSL